MKLTTRKHRWLLALAAAVASLCSSIATAEDIDLFVGGAGGGGVANVLIIIDNTSNWSRQDQAWPGGITQGQAELLAIKNVVGTLTDTVNVGLMLFTDNASGREGGYVRYAMRPMTPTNRADLQAKLQLIYDNFGQPIEKSASSANYSAVLFDAFKYFGGYTSPANARSDKAGSPTGVTAFGPGVYANADNIPLTTANFPRNADPVAYAVLGRDYSEYKPPSAAVDACGGKNYIIFIGNGFPNSDTNPQANLSTFLAGVGGDTSQIPLNEFTLTTQKTLGTSACYNTNPQGIASCNADNATVCGTAYQTCFCTTPTTTTGCSGQKVKYTIAGGTNEITPTGSSAPPNSTNIRYADEWTRFLYQTDVNSAPGQQNVTTYAIDVYNAKPSTDQTALLYNMANAAGGRYFAAKSKAEIEAALAETFAEIQAIDAVFASASLPVSATNRAQNENKIFLGIFRPDPDAKPRWYGNLKQYQIANLLGDYKLADAAGNPAINPGTGFLTECATSFWTSDSGKYWFGINTNPSPAGTCPTTAFNAFSDAPDGPKAEKGGVAEILRRGNNPGSSPTWAWKRNMYTKGFVKFDTTYVTSTELAPNDVDFIRGLNIDAGGTARTYTFDDSAGTSQTTAIRPSIHGDVVHSRPLAINYGDPTGTVVYYGANDGTFRAVKAGASKDNGTGEEMWAYVAPEFYSRLTRLRQNSPIINYAFLASVTTTPTPTPKDYFFDGSSGIYQSADNSKVWIYPTMRRGGRMIYAFNVTNPGSPSLLWKVGCPTVNLTDDTNCTSEMSDIGQTWSTPNVAKLNFDDNIKPVVVVGGGYDTCEDGAPNALCSGAKGSKVYVLDAETGTVIRSFDTAGRVPSDVALVDVDYDGLPDYAYVGDTRGNIYRISFGLSKTPGLKSADWSMRRVAYTTGAKRKFLYPPALLPAYNSTTGRYNVYLALGSGDREQPLETQYPYTTPVLNRFYVYLDDVGSTAAVDLDDSTALSDFTSSTSCGSSLVLPGSGKSGWFMDLNAYGTGEQTVSGAVIVGGLVAFSTNRPIPRNANVCAPQGEARGYWVNLFNASGAIGSEDMSCGGARSDTFEGGGLPPTPVVANIQVGDTVETIVLGAATKKGTEFASSPIGGQRGFTLKPQKRNRIYYRQEGNN